MTLAVAWVRPVGRSAEVVVAADSRLRCGYAWDGCPKILIPTRGDCVIAFAGATEHAYPMMIQVVSAIDRNLKSQTRAMALGDLVGHLKRVLVAMQFAIADLPSDQKLPALPESTFLLAGYSWREQGPRIWKISWSPVTKEIAVVACGKFCFIGDEVPTAKQRLGKLLASSGKKRGSRLNMEPFKVLVGMINDASFATIGGPPQLVKIYPHLNVRPYGVFWPERNAGAPDEEQRVSVLGRPFLAYEKTQYLVVDPKTMQTHAFANKYEPHDLDGLAAE